MLESARKWIKETQYYVSDDVTLQVTDGAEPRAPSKPEYFLNRYLSRIKTRSASEQGEGERKSSQTSQRLKTKLDRFSQIGDVFRSTGCSRISEKVGTFVFTRYLLFN